MTARRYTLHALPARPHAAAQIFLHALDPHPGHSPAGVVGIGLAAGTGATLVLSALARLLPGASNLLDQPNHTSQAQPPDPSDAQAIAAWQDRMRSPAAHGDRPILEDTQPGPGSPGPRNTGSPTQGRLDSRVPRNSRVSHAASPGGALAQPTAPGPEGLAEQFAFKIASGVFQRDATPWLRPLGIATHFTYGAAWGGLYALARTSLPRTPLMRTGPHASRSRWLAGAVYGLIVWLAGPVLLVPAMRLMRRPHQEPPARTAIMVAGHAIYGATVAGLYDLLDREGTR